jgi:hypothetical protein
MSMQAASQEEEEEEEERTAAVDEEGAVAVAARGEETNAAMMSSKQYSAFVPILFHWLQANGKPMRSIDGRLVAALVLAAALGHRSARGCGSGALRPLCAVGSAVVASSNRGAKRRVPSTQVAPSRRKPHLG